jgi:hypothetical protein
MALNLNWGKLVREGRVKAPGIDWTPEEWKAIQEGMDPEEVRAGNFTPEDVKPQHERKSLSQMTKPMLVERAKALGIEFIVAEVTRGDLIEEIQKVENKKAEQLG